MIRVNSEFSGYGGLDDGANQVPGVHTIAAANHDRHVTDTFAANFPHADVRCADITKLPATDMPYAEIFLAAPACPPWTTASGVRRDFDGRNPQTLFGDDLDLDDELGAMGADDSPAARKKRAALKKRRQDYRRARLLMKEVPRYLRAQVERGRPVLAGVVENVVQVRLWCEWDAWIREIRELGYDIKLVPYNSMHARPVRCAPTAQSRNRCFIAYWHRSLRRRPDFRKWLDPWVCCDVCDQTVQVVQVFKDPTKDMGRFQEQWVYRCPNLTCQHQVLTVPVLPALSIIDLSDPGVPIGERVARRLRPLEEASRNRVAAGVQRHWLPTYPEATVQPFITAHRGGGDKLRTRLLSDPLSTVTTNGRHHGLVTGPPLLTRMNNARGVDQGHLSTPVTEPARTVTANGKQGLLTPNPLIVPYYSGCVAAQPAAWPLPTVPTKDRFALAQMPNGWVGRGAGARPLTWDEMCDLGFDLDAIRFRMLHREEIRKAMAFRPDYRFLPGATKDQILRGLGNAVTPPVGELIVSALVEAITGEDLPREPLNAPDPGMYVTVAPRTGTRRGKAPRRVAPQQGSLLDLVSA